MDLTERIKQKALDIGFDLVGITSAEPLDSHHTDYFRTWLNSAYAAQMLYMHRNQKKRFAPKLFMPAAKSVICVALNYTPAGKTKSIDTKPQAEIANFALYPDYHKFIKDRLHILVEQINTHLTNPDSHRFRVCTDSAPLAERALAQRAGLGLIGKNHMLINPQLGCNLLLGEIVTSLKLNCDKPCQNNCSDCGRCIAACPTGAITADGSFDSNKCISYLTIEHAGEIDEMLKQKLDNHLFGCDLCIAACPYQQNTPECKNREFKIIPQLRNLEPQKILTWTQADFDKLFTGTAIHRLGLERLKANAKICLQNSKTSRD